MATQLPGHRILIVDDELLIRWALRQSLAGAGYSVLEARNGREALWYLDGDAGSIDLVLLDLRLPDSDGICVLKQIKRLQPDCKVILMTAYGTAEMAEDALAHGAFRVASKPFGLEEMTGIVSAALGQAPDRAGNADPEPHPRSEF